MSHRWHFYSGCTILVRTRTHYTKYFCKNYMFEVSGFALLLDTYYLAANTAPQR